MENYTKLKNRYLVLIIIILLFTTRYYLYFFLRKPVVTRAGYQDIITFKSFFIFNYLLGLLIAGIFCLFFFLLFKGTIMILTKTSSKIVLNVILSSYLVYFIPEIVRIAYFTFWKTDYEIRDLYQFANYFYLHEGADFNEENLTVVNYVLSGINTFDLVFFLAIYIGMIIQLKDLNQKLVGSIVIGIAVSYFSLKISIALMVY